MVAREHKKPKTCFVQVLKCQGDLELKNICLWIVDKTFDEIGSILESLYFEALLKRLDLPGIDCHCGPGEKCDWESASALKERPKVFGEY